LTPWDGHSTGYQGTEGATGRHKLGKLFQHKIEKGLGKTNDHFDALFFSQSYNPHPAMFAVQGMQGASVAASRTTKSYIFLDAPGSSAGSGAGVGFAPALARRRPLAPASSEDKENMAPASYGTSKGCPPGKATAAGTATTTRPALRDITPPSKARDDAERAAEKAKRRQQREAAKAAAAAGAPTSSASTATPSAARSLLGATAAAAAADGSMPSMTPLLPGGLGVGAAAGAAAAGAGAGAGAVASGVAMVAAKRTPVRIPAPKHSLSTSHFKENVGLGGALAWGTAVSIR
jgi:hypothetical protein